MISSSSGQDVPFGTLLVGVLPRASVKDLLTKMCSNATWREEPWQRQEVLPVVASTRDGFRFGFFGLGAATEG